MEVVGTQFAGVVLGPSTNMIEHDWGGLSFGMIVFGLRVQPLRFEICFSGTYSNI